MKDPTIAFGFGRRCVFPAERAVCVSERVSERVCPGRFFANNYLFIAVASILSVFDITHSKDRNGKVIPVPCAFESGLFS